MRDRITALHGEKTLRTSAIRSATGHDVVRHAMAGKGFRTALEIGTFKGCAAAEMAQYCERVVTIDLLHGKLEKNGDKWGREAFWRSLGVSNIELRLVKDDVEKAALVNGLDFDFAFIDGAHDAASVRGDFDMVKRCGRVLFHDVDRRGRSELDYVYDFVMSLPKEDVTVMDIFALWSPR